MRLNLIENGRDLGIIQMMSAEPTERPMPPLHEDVGQSGLGSIFVQGQFDTQRRGPE